ncbi:MAG: carbohydrate-binding protein CenC, partial [Gammaproteobacteria bacterium]|nr:carbohydrate-binding protein CenC [Gammaproteobacteria bacterium]
MELTKLSVGEFNHPQLPTRKNLMGNGNFDVWQRSTLNQTTNGFYNADRWGMWAEQSTFTSSQQAFTLGQTDVPNNPKYYMRHVVT